VTPCGVVVGYRRFGGPCCLHLQGRVEEAWTSERLVFYNITTRRHNRAKSSSWMLLLTVQVKFVGYMMKFSRAISRVKWLSDEKTNVSKTISVLVLRYVSGTLRTRTEMVFVSIWPGWQPERTSSCSVAGKATNLIVGYNLKISHRRHAYNSFLMGIVLYIIFRNVNVFL
jgi:hypothetical protein